MDEGTQQSPPQPQQHTHGHAATLASSPTLFRQPSVQLYSVIKPKNPQSPQPTPGTPQPITNESVQGSYKVFFRFFFLLTNLV